MGGRPDVRDRHAPGSVLLAATPPALTLQGGELRVRTREDDLRSDAGDEDPNAPADREWPRERAD
ncbi:hypothetical protein [Lancefieldella sp. Marseille-Q7238]|uniref:hypothetical protein n=1 Tax=Lancefieldella sp. Marseille-Q7238 TaxID=3022127 RepID=UPI0024A92505|nr:hypothetical protein [Lancefieldella sp. Marseille-Q7238]